MAVNNFSQTQSWSAVLKNGNSCFGIQLHQLIWFETGLDDECNQSLAEFGYRHGLTTDFPFKIPKTHSIDFGASLLWLFVCFAENFQTGLCFWTNLSICLDTKVTSHVRTFWFPNRPRLITQRKDIRFCPNNFWLHYLDSFCPDSRWQLWLVDKKPFVIFESFRARFMRFETMSKGESLKVKSKVSSGTVKYKVLLSESELTLHRRRTMLVLIADFHLLDASESIRLPDSDCTQDWHCPDLDLVNEACLCATSWRLKEVPVSRSAWGWLL